MQPDSLPEKQIERVVLDNGITAILVENPVADIIASRIFLKQAGSRWDIPQKAGLSHLVAAVISKGTEKYSSAEIAARVESVGASLGADASNDYFLVSTKTVSSDFEEIFQLAGELLRMPSFPKAEIELEKNLTLQSIRSQQEQPFNIAFSELRQAMYRDHPYGFSLLGTQETVVGLTQEDLQQYHQTHFRPDNIVISIAGRCDRDRALASIERVFGDWSIPEDSLPSLELPQLVSQPIQSIKPQETQQAIVMLGYLAASVNHIDYTVLKLLNSYLGNGLSSRLFVELREKRGLAYDVSAFYPTRLDDSQFITYMGTAPQNTAIAIEGLRSEVERLCEMELSEEELAAAKNKLLGQYALGKQTNSEIAQIYGWYESLGLGINFDRQFQDDLLAITAKMVREVAQRYFQQAYLSLVGPSEALSKIA
jgi:predicted Zn-dependent peptidase